MVEINPLIDHFLGQKYVQNTKYTLTVETSWGGGVVSHAPHILHLSAFLQISSGIQPWKKNKKSLAQEVRQKSDISERRSKGWR